MSILEKLGLSNLGNIRAKIAQTRSNLEDISIEKEQEGIKVVVSAGKNVKYIDIPPHLLTPENKAEMTHSLLIVLNRALNEAEGVAVKEVKEAGSSVLPGFSKIFGG